MAHRLKDVKPPGPEIRIEAFGEPIPAHEGETVAAAILATGRTVFSRSIKYHRPRGPFCLAGRCSHCLVRIDGVPNQYACRVRARPGMRVEAQNVLGSASHDALSAIDFLFPRGLDHHEMFAGVPVVEKAVAGVARHLAGLGLLPERPAEAPPACEVRRCELAVVGAGPAGLALAAEAARAGLRVELVDEAVQPGGRLLCELDGGAVSLAWASDVVDALRHRAALTMQTTALGAYRDEGGRFLALRTDGPAERLAKLYASQIALCCGGAEPLPIFEGNDLPGVFAARGLLKLIRRLGVVPGERAVVLAEHAEGLRVAEVVNAAGAVLAAVIDTRGGLSHPTLPLIRGSVMRASGRSHLSRLKIALEGGGTRTFAADLLVASAPVAPSFELARQLGVRAGFRPNLGFLPDAGADGSTPIPGVFVAGELTGPMGAEEAAAQGRRVAGVIAATGAAQEAAR